MKYLGWDPLKNEILKRERGISFEEIAYLIESGQILGIEETPSRLDQKIYILEIDNYVIIVPYAENEIFLKTAFPSRKYTKKYGSKENYQIQIKAIEEGIPYQTLISSLVHKYLNGSLT